jgi:hypothetical protein
MRVLGIYGSPRKNGNTDRMLDAFLEGAESAGGEVARVYVRRLQMGGCLGCGGCDEDGHCVVDDEMQKIYPLLVESPRIAVASPVYFYGVTGQLKLLVDRSQALYMRKELAKRSGEYAPPQPPRRGFFLSAGATRGKRNFECPSLCLRYFFDAVDAEFTGELCFREIEEKGAIADHPDALEQCRRAGASFAGD